ncbi:putative Histone deacetylase 2a [Corchorus olitorius]|uniref:Histone deacetylase 2a n=1 Tax=Corchorus olitorius TaxID=93759 RepID=A0A1R3JCR0_9ROSI|nr:putative Histone deacetylase 2a [Corchorus olitorius]
MASNAKENVPRSDYDGYCNICKHNFGSLAAIMEHQKVAHAKKETKYKWLRG